MDHPTTTPSEPGPTFDPAPVALAPTSALARVAGPLLLVSSILSAVGVAFFILMYASFAAGATSAGMSFGFVNDVLGLVVCVLTMPGVIALHELIGVRSPGRDLALRVLGLGSLCAIVILQWLLVTGGLTFEQQIGPVALAYIALGAWFIVTGRMAARRRVLAHGTRLGVLAATYFGYPVWAYRLGRLLGRRPDVSATVTT